MASISEHYICQRTFPPSAVDFAYGFDGILRMFGDDYLSVNWAQTFEDGAPNRFASLAPARSRIDWERRLYDGLGYSFSLGRAGVEYNPGIGFELRDNYTSFGDRIWYGWLPKGSSPLERHQLSFLGSVFLRNADGSIESVETGPMWDAAFRSGALLRMAVRRSHENLRAPFKLSDEAEVPEGTYTFYLFDGRFESPGGQTANAILTLNAGSFYDGWRFSAGVAPRWTLSRYVELSGFYEFNRIAFPDRHQELDVHLGRVRVQLTLNTKVAATAFVQYNTLDDAAVTNIRLRYNPREGSDLYLVYNEGLNTNRDRSVPPLPFTAGRVIVTKYTSTFRL